MTMHKIIWGTIFYLSSAVRIMRNAFICIAVFFVLLIISRIAFERKPAGIVWPRIDPWSDVIKEEHLKNNLPHVSPCSIHRDAQSSKPFVVFLVLSHPASYGRRTIIRDTWAHSSALELYTRLYNVDILVYFVLGSVMGNHNLTQRLQTESRSYKDIIQGTFDDVYRNMSTKTVFAIKYAVEYCTDADYIVRMNDDVFVNGFYFFEFMKPVMSKIDSESHVGFGRMCSLAGNPLSRDRCIPIRDPASKFYVTQSEYPFDVYPKYLYGQAYVLSRSLAKLFNYKAIISKHFWIDDIFVGLALTNEPSVRYHNLGRRFSGLDAKPADPSHYKRSAFTHLIEKSMYTIYVWWGDVLVDRGLLKPDDRLRLKLTSPDN